MSGVTVPTMIASRSEGASATFRKGFLCCFHCQVAGGYALVHDVPLADSGAFRDPLIRGFYHLLEVGVGQQAGRDVSPKSADLDSGDTCGHKLAHSMSSPVGI